MLNKNAQFMLHFILASLRTLMHAGILFTSVSKINNNKKFINNFSENLTAY